MSYWGGTAIGAVDQDGDSQSTTHQIYSNASGEYALGIRSDATVGRGVFIRGGSNDNYESLLVTSYDEQHKRFAIMGGGTVIFGEDGAGNLAVDSGTRYQFNGGKVFVTGSRDGDYITEIRNEDADNGYGLRVSAGDDNNVLALAVANKDQSTKLVVTGAGNLGVGETAPGNPIHIKSDSGTGIRMYVDESNPLRTAIVPVSTSGNHAGYISFRTMQHNIGGDPDQEHMVVTSQGKIGIGTNSPSAPLHVSGANDTTFASSAGGNPANLFLQGSNSYNSGYSGGGIFFIGEYQSGASTTFAAVSGIKENTTSGQYGGALTIYTRANGAGAGAVERMRISSTGLIGINNNSPGAKLDIKGDTDTWAGMAKIFLTDTSSNSNRRNWSIGNGGSGYGHLSFVRSNAADGVPSDSTGTVDMCISETGNVGIGTVSPAYNLEIYGTFYSAGSSREYKEDISDLEIDSSLIYNLRPVSYNLKDEFKHLGYDLGGDKQLGLISEEVNDIIPELAIIKDGKPKNVDYEKLSILLLKEVQNLRGEIDNLKKVQ